MNEAQSVGWLRDFQNVQLAHVLKSEQRNEQAGSQQHFACGPVVTV
jgi:hypothetical protein